jgi:hypothetical protein
MAVSSHEEDPHDVTHYPSPEHPTACTKMPQLWSWACFDASPEELFAAEDETDWDEWVDFFRQTREPDRRRKGLVEIRL